MTNWRTEKLGQVLPFKYGKGLPKPLRSETGECDVMSSAGVVGTHSSAVTVGPSVVIGRKGSIGTVYFCPNPVFPIDTAFYVEPSDEMDIRFAYYLLRTLPLGAMNNDSAVPGLNRAQAEALEVQVPSIGEQREIAATLSALDDKISSNRTAVDKAVALIRAKMLESIEHESILIPVARLASFVNGGAYTKGASGHGRLVIRIAELNSGPGPATVYNDIEVPDEKLARSGDILMAWSGSLGVHRWSGEEAIINQHIFKVIPTSYPSWLVFDRLDAVMPVFEAIAKNKATTMGHIQRGHLVSTEVAVPSESAIAGLDGELASLWEWLVITEHEIGRLLSVRDTLLPELVSGRIRVPIELDMAGDCR